MWSRPPTIWGDSSGRRWIAFFTQDYPHIDYIVMDAGSKDDTVEILNSYNGRLRFESKPDKGQADAVNKGFAISRGQSLHVPQCG